MPYKLFIAPKAQRQIKALPEDVQGRVRKAVRTLRENPRPRGFKKISIAEDLFRIRVGNYRLVYTISDQLLLVLVLTIGDRKEIYKRLSSFTPERIQSLLERTLPPDA